MCSRWGSWKASTPPMYILDVEEGARISTDYVCNYVAKVVAGSLILKILADFYAVS